MKTTRIILTTAALAVGVIATTATAQTFQTNNGVIIGSPGVLPPPNNNGGAIIPTPPGGPVPPMPSATNRFGTNQPWNVRSNGNMFPGTNGVRRVPISSNLPGTSLQPPDSSLPPMTNAPGQGLQTPQPGTEPTQPGTIPPRQLDPNNPNSGQRQMPNQPARPVTPPVRK